MSHALWVHVPGRLGAPEEVVRADQIIALRVHERPADVRGRPASCQIDVKVFPHDTDSRTLVTGLSTRTVADLMIRQFIRACVDYRDSPAILTLTPQGVEISNLSGTELP
ncbi:hypothetical protein GCM10027167_44360 [Nocardia heshunensis]